MPWPFRRRNADADVPFPREWHAIVERNCSFLRGLGKAIRAELLKSTQQFIERKQFVGARRMSVTDEMRVTIAAHACLLVIARPDLGLYPQTREIVVYPETFGDTVEAIGPDGRRYHTLPEIAGQHMNRGPVIVSWGDARRSIADPADGYNVMFHEFAHALERMDGAYDGLPPLENPAQTREWVRTIKSEYDALLADLDAGRRTLIRPYGATNPSEFFAVVTEHFFEQPRELAARHPELYERFTSFYRLDPRRWGSRAFTSMSAENT